MLRISPEQISVEAFAPFGHLLEPGSAVQTEAGRASTRTIIERKQVLAPSSPHVVDMVERHPHDSQAFLPLGGSPFLVVVCPNKPDGMPDSRGIRVFKVPGSIGIQYRPGTWHADMTALSGDREMVVIMDRDYGDGDFEGHRLDEPVEVLL
jgi:ureidoglycolate lyase